MRLGLRFGIMFFVEMSGGACDRQSSTASTDAQLQHELSAMRQSLDAQREELARLREELERSAFPGPRHPDVAVDSMVSDGANPLQISDEKALQWIEGGPEDAPNILSDSSPTATTNIAWTADEDRVRQALELAFRQQGLSATKTQHHWLHLEGKEDLRVGVPGLGRLSLERGDRLTIALHDHASNDSTARATLAVRIGEHRFPISNGRARVARCIFHGGSDGQGEVRIENPLGLSGLSIEWIWTPAVQSTSRENAFEALIAQDSYRKVARRMFMRVRSNGSRIRHAANETSAIRRVAAAGEVVRVFRQDGMWMEIRDASGATGWTAAALLEDLYGVEAASPRTQAAVSTTVAQDQIP